MTSQAVTTTSSKTMRIDVLHLLPSLSVYGGTPRKIRDLIQSSNLNHAIYCWAAWEGKENRDSSAEAFQSIGIRTFTSTHGKNALRHASEIRRIIKDNNVLVVHGYFESGLILASLAKLYCPSIKTVSSFVGFPASISTTRRWAINLLARNIDEIIYVSRYTRDAFEEEHSILKSIESQVIYNGVKKRWPIKAKRSAPNLFQAATVSGLVKWKNIELLLEVTKIVTENQTKDFKLFIIGDGPMRAELEETATHLGIKKYVEFCGYEEDIGSILAVCNAYLHPALTEGFGIAVVEAMLMGIPVIVADSGALPELVENEVSGLVIEATDSRAWSKAIRRLREDSSFAMRLGEEGLARANKCFSIDRFVAEHEDLYKKLISGRLHSK